MTSPTLTARELRGGYRNDIFQDVSFSIAPGELVALVGPNGAGKSALMLTLCGQLPASGGEVLLDSSPLASYKLRDRARKLAWLGQQEAGEADFLVQENVALGRNPHASGLGLAWNAADQAAIRSAIASCQLESLGDRAMRQLSGGERQRARIARALAQIHGQPRALLCLDEPTTFLDLPHQLELMLLLSHLAHEQGLAILAILHDLNQAAMFCDRLLLMAQGTLLAQGTAQEILTPRTLAQVFGIQAQVLSHPQTGTPYLLPLAPSLDLPMGTCTASLASNDPSERMTP